MARVVVIGGGITGLAAAYRLQELARDREAAIELQVLESGPRPGGIISSQLKDGFLLEEGPDSFITDKPWALALAKRLGLEKELLPTNPTRKSYIAWGNDLHAIPEGFHLMAPGSAMAVLKSGLFSLDGKIRVSMERLIKQRKIKEDESVGSFVQRRLGKEALERLVQPLVSGIYGGDPHEMSMLATFPRFVEMEERHGSLSAAMSARKADGGGSLDEGVSGARYSLFVSLKKGISSMVEALIEALPGGSVLVGAAVQSLARVAGKWEITLDTGYKTTADGIILALPAPKAARFIQPFDEQVAKTLAEIKYAPSVNLHMAYPWAALPRAPEGFGFVVPSLAKSPLLGCTFASAKFPGRAPKDKALLRAFVAPTHFNWDEEDILTAVRQELSKWLGAEGEPFFTHFKRYNAALPQYTVGHMGRIAAMEWRVKTLPRLALAGNAYRGVGLPDCIKSAEEAAELLWAKLLQPSHG
jgi:protoporphyrinogen/coproporphyrinogen III oxidase